MENLIGKNHEGRRGERGRVIARNGVKRKEASFQTGKWTWKKNGRSGRGEIVRLPFRGKEKGKQRACTGWGCGKTQKKGHRVLEGTR